MVEDRQQYTCPECGAVGAGPKGATYKCHRCPCLLMLPSHNGKILAAATGEKECNCDLRTKLVGDGCEVCNPELALEHAREIILEQEKTIGELIVALDEMVAHAYEEDWDMGAAGSACLSAAENALAVARGEI